nr:immunoglobulin heavy chain junction region [Mus musculus]
CAREGNPYWYFDVW